LTEPGVLYIAFSFATTSEPAMLFHIFELQTECTGVMIVFEIEWICISMCHHLQHSKILK